MPLLQQHRRSGRQASFYLSEREACIADMLLGLNGEVTEGGMFVLTRKLFPELKTNKEVKRAWLNYVKWEPRTIFRKIERVWRLSPESYALLVAVDPWYKKLNCFFPQRTQEALSSISERVLKPAALSKKHYSRREYSKETIVRTCTQRAGEKKIFLRLSESDVWEHLRPSEQELLAAYFGFDLPGEETRPMHEVAQKFNLNLNNLKSFVWRVKRHLRRLDPSLPFRVVPSKTPWGRRAHIRAGEKEVFLRFSKTDVWSRINELDQKAISAYYGLDLPGERTRTIPSAAKKLNIGVKTLEYRMQRIKSEALYLHEGGTLEARPWSPPKSPGGWFLQRAEEKKIWSRIRETALWDELDPSVKNMISSYYGFDLPEGKTRTLAQASSELHMSAWQFWRQLQETKRQLKKLDPDLPFVVHAPRRRQRKKSESEGLPSDCTMLERYRADIARFSEVDDAVVYAHQLKMQEGNSGEKENIFHAGLRYVFPVAYGWHFDRVVRETAFDVLDLIQEGNIGLWQTLDSFSGMSQKEYQEFVKSAAKHNIKKSLKEAGMSISLDPHLTVTLRNVSQAFGKLQRTLQREPEAREIAQFLNIPVATVEGAMGAMRISVLPTVSLDDLERRHEEEGTKMEFAADALPLPPDQALEATAREIRDRWLAESVERSLRTILAPLEQQVISMLFGFSGESLELSEVAVKLETSKKVIERVMNRALKKLRSDPLVIERMKRFSFWCGT